MGCGSRSVTGKSSLPENEISTGVTGCWYRVETQNAMIIYVGQVKASLRGRAMYKIQGVCTRGPTLVPECRSEVRLPYDHISWLKGFKNGRRYSVIVTTTTTTTTAGGKRK